METRKYTIKPLAHCYLFIVLYSGQANYATAKAGLVGLTKTVAKVRSMITHGSQAINAAISRNGALNSVFEQIRRVSMYLSCLSWS